MDEIRKLTIEEVNQRFLVFINKLDILSRIGILPETYRSSRLLAEYKDVIYRENYGGLTSV